MSNNVFKRTKILATIGPATFSQEKVFQLLDAGVNGIRMNFSHGDNESRLEQINWVRTASQRLGKPVAILQDLQGAKIRLGILQNRRGGRALLSWIRSPSNCSANKNR